MPRPKKGSPEAKAWGEQMKAKRLAKNKDVPEEIVSNENENALLKRIEELEARLNLPPKAPDAPVATSRTVVTKFSFNPKDYPDVRDRFFSEPKLTLKGFNKDWFDLGWEVQRVTYEEDGQKTAAPRFLLELYRIMENPETGEPSNKRYTVKRGLFFEDPDSYLEIASRHGIDIPESFEQWFMDEMRYLNMRDWLLDVFYPPKPAPNKQNKSEMVINNRLVEVFEASDTNPVSFKL